MRRITLTTAFLSILIVGLIAAAVTVKATQGSEPSRFEQLALRADAILDSLPEHQFDLFEPNLWMYEITPYFEYEGLVSRATYPDSADFALFPGFSNFHILGKAQCTREGGGPIFINARGLNPLSPRYSGTWLLPTLVHELIHAQGGGFCYGTSETLESTTQMGTLEVLAAMANHGSTDAAFALLDELRDMAMSAVYYEALRDNDEDRYIRLRDRIYTSPLERARSEKSRRFWSETTQSRAHLRELLNKYNFIPLGRALDGLADECICIKNLYMGEWVEPGKYAGPPPDRYAARSLDIDDLFYFVANMESIAAELREEPE